MQEKTLEEECEMQLQDIMEDYLFDARLTDKAKDKGEHMEIMRGHWKILKDFISSREEKAREEGRKEYKEELLGELPEERKYKGGFGETPYISEKDIGFNKCLSEVKKLIN